MILCQSDLILYSLVVLLRSGIWLEKREFQILFKEEILFNKIKSSMLTESFGYATATIIIPYNKILKFDCLLDSY